MKMQAMPATLELTDANRGGSGGPTPEELLARFGLEAFRPGQREAVQAALDGRDSLVVMPTGGGKSLCYQLPALASDWNVSPAGVGVAATGGDLAQAAGDLVVVVSPLIALMADQWRRLQDAGVRAAMLASGMADGHNEQALRDIEAGATQLVLAAPERFASGAFRAALARRRSSEACGSSRRGTFSVRRASVAVPYWRSNASSTPRRNQLLSR